MMKLNEIRCRYTTKEKYILLLAYMYLIISPIIKIWLLHYFISYKLYVAILFPFIIITTILNYKIIKYYYIDLTKDNEPRRSTFITRLIDNNYVGGKMFCIMVNISFIIASILMFLYLYLFPII